MVEIARRQRRSEEISALRVVEHVGAVLAPELIARRGQAAGVTVEDLHRSLVTGAEVLVRDAHRDVVVAVAVEVAHRQDGAEAISVLGLVEHSRAALEQPCRLVRLETGGAARDHVDGSRLDGAADLVILPRNADDEVGEGIVVEVADRQGGTEEIAVLACVPVEIVLVEELGAGCVEPVLGAEEDVEGSGVVGAARVFAGDPERQVLEPVAVEVGGRQGETELVAGLRDVGDAGDPLMPELVVLGGEPGRRGARRHSDPEDAERRSQPGREPPTRCAHELMVPLRRRSRSGAG
ncbi:MAG: hypothetical protein R2991_11590 [Thermoanaerobaculia bacterium]